NGSPTIFYTRAEVMYSFQRFHVCHRAQTPSGVAVGSGGCLRPTAMSGVIVLHPAGTPPRTSVACQVPTAGEVTSANQKYGGPPCRSRDLTASFPSGAISESSPSTGSSAAKTTRKGAPFQGAIGEDRTATSAAPAQLLSGSLACRSDAAKTKTKNTPPTRNNAVTAPESWRARINGAPFLDCY